MSYQEKVTNEQARLAIEGFNQVTTLDMYHADIWSHDICADLLHAREERDKAVAMVREALELLKSHLADNPKQSELYCYCGLCKDTRAFLEKAREYAEE